MLINSFVKYFSCNCPFNNILLIFYFSCCYIIRCYLPPINDVVVSIGRYNSLFYKLLSKANESNYTNQECSLSFIIIAIKYPAKFSQSTPYKIFNIHVEWVGRLSFQFWFGFCCWVFVMNTMCFIRFYQDTRENV